MQFISKYSTGEKIEIGRVTKDEEMECIKYIFVSTEPNKYIKYN
jgi:hypothetical protein